MSPRLRPGKLKTAISSPWLAWELQRRPPADRGKFDARETSSWPAACWRATSPSISPELAQTKVRRCRGLDAGERRCVARENREEGADAGLTPPRGGVCQAARVRLAIAEEDEAAR